MRHIFKSATLSASALVLAVPTANAVTVWNVNVGSTVAPITTTDDYVGAATENTAMSTWNGIDSAGTTTLDDSTGDNSAGVTINIAATTGTAFNFGNSGALTTGDEIFRTWMKDDGNNDPYVVTFGNLTTATYDLVIYSDWFWNNGTGAVTVEQTAGSGLTGVFSQNRLINDADGGGVVGPALLDDTNPANNNDGNYNFHRYSGLTADGSGNISFELFSGNGPVNGFQLIDTTVIPEPSSLALLGLSGLALLGRRRK